MVKDGQGNTKSTFVWNIMNRVRTAPVSSYEVFVYLLYVSRLIKSGFKNSDYFTDVYHSVIRECTTPVIQNIHNIFSSDVELLIKDSSQVLNDVISEFCTVSDELYCGKLEELLLVIGNRNHLGCYSQPKEVTELLCEIANYTADNIIYNPFAGVASYGVNLNAKTNYYGQEINDKVWAVGVLRLLAHKIDPTNFVQSDSVWNWSAKHPDNATLPSFDLIVATPPFGVRPNITFGSECEPFNSHTTIEEYFVTRGLYGLSSTGKLIGLFSSKMLYGNGLAKYIRQDSVSKDLLDTVITLPRNLLSSTSVSTSIVLFSQQKDHKGYVRMIDGSLLFEKKGKLNTLNVSEILDRLHCEDSSACLVSNDDIAAKDYNITPALYLCNPLESVEIPVGYEFKKLNELVSLYRGQRSLEGKYRFVRGKNLVDSRFRFNVTFEDIEPELINQRVYVLDKDLLLLLKIGKLKPTLYRYKEGVDVCVNPNIIALDVRKDRVHPEYLANELCKEYIAKQVEVYSNGVAMQSISVNSLLEIEVLVPSSNDVDYQAIIDKERLEYNEQRRAELESENLQLKTDRQKEFEKNMRTRRHAMNQVLNGLTSAISLVDDCVIENSIGKHIVSQRTGETLDSYVRRIASNVKKLEGMVDGLLVENKYGIAKMESVEDCILAYQKAHLSGNYTLEVRNCKWEKDDDDDEDIYYNEDGIGIPSDEKPCTSINVAKEDLFQVFDNIVDNAKKYGFIDPERKDYIVRFEFDVVAPSSEKLEVVISISNNGESLSRGITPSNIFDWGKGNGSGIGAWQVKEIVEHYGGAVELNEYPNDPFSVEYKIKFPYRILDEPSIRNTLYSIGEILKEKSNEQI